MSRRAAVRKIGEFTGCTGSWSRRPFDGNSQQPANANRRSREDRDLAERVKGTEIDQDDVDDVAAVPECRAELGKVLPQARSRFRRRHRQEQTSDEGADPDGNQRVAGANEPRRQLPEPPEMPEDEDVDEHSEGFHRELCHRKVGRAEAEEDDGDAVADRPKREDRRHRRARNGRGNRTGDDDQDDEDVVSGDAGAQDRGAKARSHQQRGASDQG